MILNNFEAIEAIEQKMRKRYYIIMNKQMKRKSMKK